MRRSVIVAFFCAVAMAVLAPASLATPRQVDTTIDIPATATANIEAVQCDNTGSTINIGGTLTVGSWKAKLQTYQNVNKQRTVTGDVALNLQVFPEAGDAFSVDQETGEVTIPKQPSRLGVGGNPWISFAFTDQQGNQLSDFEIVGRCVQGLKYNVKRSDLTIPTSAGVFAQGLECSNKSTKMNFRGKGRTQRQVNGTVLMANQRADAVHQAKANGRMSLAFTPEAGAEVLRQGGHEGTGGNPYVSLQFLQGQPGEGGATVWSNAGKLNELGRCKQLM